MPYKFEAGNLNVPGIAGLGAGCAFLQERGIESVHAATSALAAQFRDDLSRIQGVTLYGPEQTDRSVSVVSLNIAGYDPQEVAAMLDAEYRIQVRSGLHCAARIHQSLGTHRTGGTVRFSFGPFNNAEQIGMATAAVCELSTAAAALH
jgi:selenocysteine lyase/cysteine desulfurase